MSKISEAFKDTKAFIPFITEEILPWRSRNSFYTPWKRREQTLLRSGSLFQILLQKVL